ncbi:hypothetical protein TNCV_1845901 [Trichonephila clavipes]|nr:hypothetical protein TNCV_1845901 [Trichonephila clavipes]
MDQSLGCPDLHVYRDLITFYGGHRKNLVYTIPLDADEDLLARISEVAAHVRKIPDIIERDANCSTDTVKHVPLLVDSILNSYCKQFVFPFVSYFLCLRLTASSVPVH